MAATGRHSAAGDKTDRLQDILQSSGVSYTQADLDRKPVAQKTGVTAADRYFNKAGLSNPNPTTVSVNPNGQAPAGLRVGDTVRTAGGDYEITNALAPGASYNRETGLWSKRTTDQYGTPLETGKNYRYGEEKPGYDSQWQQQIRNAVARLLGYNYDTYKQGPEYAGLERDYTRLGQRAMDDTMGKIAARTGGMASSYAGTASQQAYNDYMQQLEAAARQHYQQERSNQTQDINLLMALEDQGYGQYADLLRQWNTDRDFDYGLFSDNYSRQYQQARDRVTDERYVDELAYGRGRDAIADARYEDELTYGRSRDAIEDERYADELAWSRGQQTFGNQLDAISALNQIVAKYGFVPTWAQSLLSAARGAALPSAAAEALTPEEIAAMAAGPYYPVGSATGGGSGGSSGGSSGGGGSSSRRSSGGGNPGYSSGGVDGPGTTPPADNDAIKRAAYEAARGRTQSGGTGDLSTAAAAVYNTAIQALSAGENQDAVVNYMTKLLTNPQNSFGPAEARAVVAELARHGYSINLGI